MGDRYAETLQRLESLGRLGVRLGLDATLEVLARLSTPQRRFAAVHLAGTNGKGSTAAMLAACLQAAGIRTGLYTSPHLSRFTERIRVDGEEIGREQVADLADEVLGQGVPLSFFEAVTAMAFLCFARQGVELAVVETGLGGRLDATNVLTPLVCALTCIDLDHTDLLGSLPAQVAAEKAGIIKPGVPVASAAARPEVERVIAARAAELGAPLSWHERDFRLEQRGPELVYTGPEWQVEGLQPGLAGPFQRENAALCLAVLEHLRQRGFAVEPEAVRRGLAAVRWPGRMEWVGDDLLLDGAHNPAGARALAAALPRDRQFTVVLGLIGAREASELVAPLLPHVGRLVLTRPQSPRALAPERLAASVEGLGCRAEVAPDLASALSLARGFEDPVLVTGSLYLVGEARQLLLGEPADPLRTADPLPGP